MKLVLSNFGQDISLQGEPTTVYLVFTDEETGDLYRIPTVQESVTRLAQILDGSYKGEPTLPEPPSGPELDDTEEETEAPSDEVPEGAHVFGGDGAEPEPEPAEEGEKEPVPDEVPVLPRNTLRKRLVPPATGPTRLAIQRVRERLDEKDGEDPESKVPGL